MSEVYGERKVKAVLLTIVGMGIALYGAYHLAVYTSGIGNPDIDQWSLAGSMTAQAILSGFGSFVMWYAKRFWNPVKTKETEQHS